MDVFEELADCMAITADGSLLPGISLSPIGASAVVVSRASATRKLEEWKEDLELTGRGAAALEPLGDPWHFMRRAAGEGLGSVVDADTGSLCMFMVRVEEAGSQLPTVLTAHNSDRGWGQSLTRNSRRTFTHAELLHWTRYDILDRVSGTFGQLAPFRHWENGDPFFELAHDDVVTLILEAPLMGDWNSTDGSYPFFTSEEDAHHYLEAHLPNQRHIKVLGGTASTATPLEVRPVADLRERLAQLRAINPLFSWCVNPDDHRENQAFGRLHDPWSPTSDSVRMSAVSGIWAVGEGNRFELVESLPGWSGRDTIAWSGGQGLALAPLDHSFVGAPLAETVQDGGLTNLEAEELIDGVLAEAQMDRDWETLDEGEAPELDRFVVSCWDSVTGFGQILNRPDFLGTLASLTAYEREHDSHHRASGAQSCVAVGFQGSADPAAEDVRSSRFRSGLQRMGARALLAGYKPSDAEDLVALCNAVLGTLHVDYAGYVKDLVWAVNDNELDGLLDDLALSPETIEHWRDSAKLAISTKGEALGIERVGEDTWGLMCERSRFFVATALQHLERQGHAPQLDYAPISIEIVKALEVELGELLRAFRSGYLGEINSVDADPWFIKELARFLEGGKAPTLGAFGHYLHKPAPADSGLLREVRSFMAGAKNATFLLNRKFRQSGLYRVSNTYRNGGAHDSPISEETCRMCVAEVLGCADSPGFIPQLVDWKTRA